MMQSAPEPSEAASARSGERLPDGVEGFRDLLDAAPILIWLSDAEGVCNFLSRSWYEFTGQTPREALGWGWLNAIHPADRQHVRDAFNRSRRELRPYQVEYRVRNVSGAYRWMLDSAAPRFDKSGALSGYVGSIVDNEERKRAELALARSEGRLRIALQAAELGIWEWDFRTNLIRLSTTARSIYGLGGDGDAPIEAAIIEALVHPDDLAKVQAITSRSPADRHGAHETYRYRIRRADDGRTRWLLALGEPLFGDGPDPEPLAFIGTLRDVTEELETQERLVEGEERLRLALEAADLAVWEYDPASERVWPSPELNALFGFPPDFQPSIHDLRTRYAEGELERLRQLAAEAAARGDGSISVELKLVLPDGTERWLLLRARLPQADGASGRVLGVAMDITSQKIAEGRLTTIAHELQHRVKNSLTIVQALANQSLRSGRSVEEGLQSFSERLRAFAATTEAVFLQDWRSADLLEVVTRAVEPYRDGERDPFVIAGARVQIPSETATSVGMALHELCTNAIKYGALSTPTGSVGIAWREEAGQVLLDWQERGGPPVTPPRDRGFGTRLLRAGLFGRDRGAVDLRFEPEGVVCNISLILPGE